MKALPVVGGAFFELILTFKPHGDDRMAKALMIQGTMSNAGKSLITAGLCRLFKQDGYRVAPFKSQNMALNSYITADGKEMGRAQAVQAEAAGLLPDVRMNPILLKPTSDTGSQVILMGAVQGNMKAADYYRRKTDYIPVIREAYESLAGEYEIIVIEGAGSPVEINLKENDIVNMGMAGIADAAVLLVGDIDRGGVFAQLLGTMELFEPDERDRVKGLIINKFRGDVSILEPGLKMIEDRCAKPVIGVVPYSDIHIEDEDSLAGELTDGFGDKCAGAIDIAIVRLKWISNFTDADSFRTDKDVCIRYVTMPDEIGTPDMILIPGSKNTMADMRFLRECGLEAAIKRLASKGVIVFGICGGYQLMGHRISDEVNAEGGGSMDGMGLLPVNTVFDDVKVTRQVIGHTSRLRGPFEMLSDINVSGYEIHMGRSEYIDERPAYFTVNEPECTNGESREDGQRVYITNDGCVNGNCIGTYMHGIFDNTDFRDALVDIMFKKKGMNRKSGSVSYKEYKEEQYDALAGVLRASLDIDKIYKILGLRK